MRKIFKIIVLVALLFGVEKAYSQHDNNILLYSNQAVLFGEQGSAFDPVSIIIPGTAMKSGLGSFIDNPASMALYKESFGEFGLSYKNINEEADYLGNVRSLDNNQTDVSNAGFLYSFPTKQGSFVIGAAYSQHSTFTRALGFRARNNNSTITDEFKTDGSIYRDIAFNTYATDYGDEVGDWDESIFRIGFDELGDYLGITQQGEILQNGKGGEYSLFFATEFQKNLMVGASIGLLSGKFKYDRTFQEIDEFNDYNSQIIDSNEIDGGDTDMDNIILDDKLTSRYTGFRARAGLLYKASENVNLGVSYTLPTTLSVEEDFSASIRSTFDNNEVFSDATDSEFSYDVKYPGRVAIGLAAQNLSGVTASVSAEYTDYSNAEIEFEESDLFEDELLENDFIKETFQSVWSYRAGLAYELNPELTVRAGYGFKPSKFEDGNDDRSSYSFGAGFSIGNGIRFEAAAQYTMWDEVRTVYDYGVYDYDDLPEELPGISFESEVADRSAERWQFLGTIIVDL